MPLSWPARLLILAAALSACAPTQLDLGETDAGVLPSTARARYDVNTDRLTVLLDAELPDTWRAESTYRRGVYGGKDCTQPGTELEVSGDRLFGPGAARELTEPWQPAGHGVDEAPPWQPLIDVCVFDGVGRLRLAAAIPLLEAMDEPADHFVRPGDPMPISYGLTTGSTIYSSKAYAEQCVEELGAIPFFEPTANGWDTYDCMAGTEIPVAVTDDPTVGAVEANVEPANCDEPQQLGYGCEVGAHVSHDTNARGTEWVLLCRKVAASGTAFRDIAMIGHNPGNGKTCFFQNDLYQDKRHVPHPAAANATTVWGGYPSGGSCMSCHDHDPYIHTPWIDGAGEVPFVGTATSPYSVVNQVDQHWDAKQQLVEPGTESCRSCHRVGEWKTINWAKTLTDDTYRYNPMRTTWAETAPQKYWMPPGPSYSSETAFNTSSHGQAVAKIDACIADPSSCAWAPIPTGKVTIRDADSGSCALTMGEIEQNALPATRPSRTRLPALPERVYEPQFDMDDLISPRLSDPWIHQLLTPGDAHFDCGGDASQIEILASESSGMVQLRTTNADGATCYLISEEEGIGYAPSFGGSLELQWDCSFGSGSDFSVQHVGDAVRLQHDIGGTSCGITLTSATGSTDKRPTVNCSSAGDLLTLAAPVTQTWKDQPIAAYTLRTTGPFKVVAGQTLTATVAPGAGNSGDADLYVGTTSTPMASASCTSLSPSSNETCTVTAPTGGQELWVTVYG